MGVKIVIDSSADVAENLKGRFEVVPLPIYFGDEKFIDGVNLTHAEFYGRLKNSEQLPKTSQATPFDYEEVFEKIVSAGDDAVVITIAEKLSGTYQSAVIAAKKFAGRVYVVDSKTVTLASGILAEYALRLVGRASARKSSRKSLKPPARGFGSSRWSTRLNTSKRAGGYRKRSRLRASFFRSSPS